VVPPARRWENAANTLLLEREAAAMRPMHLSTLLVLTVATAATGSIAAEARPLLPVFRAHAPAQSWMSPDAKKAQQLLYVAGGSSGNIDVFSIANGQATLVGKLTGFSDPQGITTDAAGNLYVVDDYVPEEGPVGGQVDVFAKGSKKASRTIVPSPWVPFDVGVDRKGNIYIANIAPIAKFTPGSVTVYGPSSDVKPIRTLKGDALKEIFGIAVDPRTSDAYVTYTPDLGGAGRLAVFHSGRGAAQDLGVSFGPPWGVRQDGNGNLLVSDGNGTMDVFPQVGGSQTGSFEVPGAPLFSAFNTDRSQLFVSNFNNHDIEVFNYPSETMTGSITESEWSVDNWPTGVAFWPPAH
jgi:DNA-binding beta-propeller fold protein YncE